MHSMTGTEDIAEFLDRLDIEGEWLVFDPRAVEGKDPDAWVAGLLDRVCPRWRKCVSE